MLTLPGVLRYLLKFPNPDRCMHSCVHVSDVDLDGMSLEAITEFEQQYLSLCNEIERAYLEAEDQILPDR